MCHFHLASVPQGQAQSLDVSGFSNLWHWVPIANNCLRIVEEQSEEQKGVGCSYALMWSTEKPDEMETWLPMALYWFMWWNYGLDSLMHNTTEPNAKKKKKKQLSDQLQSRRTHDRFTLLTKLLLAMSLQLWLPVLSLVKLCPIMRQLRKHNNSQIWCQEIQQRNWKHCCNSAMVPMTPPWS